MPVIACPRCQQPLSLDAAVLGQHVQCPACKQVFQTTPAAPAPPAVRKVVATPIAPPPQGVPTSPPPAFDPAAAFAGLGQDEPGAAVTLPTRRPPKKRSLLVPLLLGGAVLLLLCCGGGGVVAWLGYKKAHPPLVFKPFTTPDGSCSVLFPGEPLHGGTRDTYHDFSFSDLPKDLHLALIYSDYGTDAEQARAADEAMDIQLRLWAKDDGHEKTPVKLGSYFGTDHIQKQNGKVVGVVRQLEIKGKQSGRKLLLVAVGTDLSDEDRAKFLNSYKQLKPVK